MKLLVWALAAAASDNNNRPLPAANVSRPGGEDTGYDTIFDGKTLNGWEGDPKYWRVENGALVGEVTPETLLKANTFIIWRGGVTKDFELKVEYRISAGGNSGINYRSVEVPGLKFAMRCTADRHIGRCGES